MNTKIRKEKDLALHFVADVFFDACICLFVNSPSLLLVSEAGHQKGRENKSGPARQGLSYITTPRRALKLYFCSTSIETILQRARESLSYIARPISTHCTFHYTLPYVTLKTTSQT